MNVGGDIDLLNSVLIGLTESFYFFFLIDPPPTEFSPLPLHDALPIFLAASLWLATACEAPREVAAPARGGSPRLQASLLDPALAAALAGAAPTATLEIIVNYD